MAFWNAVKRTHSTSTNIGDKCVVLYTYFNPLVFNKGFHLQTDNKQYIFIRR